MRELIVVKLNEDQMKRLKSKLEAMASARTAMSAAADMIKFTEKEMWDDVHDMIDLPENSRPAVNWVEKQVTYFK